MRDYGSVSPAFWLGKTGRELRGDPEAQVLALYLMTGPHATAIGVFHCPVLYMAHETGLPIEGASKALRRLIEGGFCTYEWDSEWVFVRQMAKYQIADTLKKGDKRVVWLRKEVAAIPVPRMVAEFLEVHAENYGLTDLLKECRENGRGIEGASEPHRSQEQEQEQDIKKQILSIDSENVGSTTKAFSILTPTPKRPGPGPEAIEKAKRTAADRKRRMASATELLQLLSAKSGKRFGVLDSNLEPIADRLAELERMDGPTLNPEQAVDVCRGMIVRMAKRWSGTEFEPYLRPHTLFGKQKFGGYVADTLASMFPAGSEPVQAELIAAEPEPDQELETADSVPEWLSGPPDEF